MKIYLGTDHAGFALKEAIKAMLLSAGHDVSDLGAKEFVDGDDYPDHVRPVAEAVARETKAGATDVRGIILGGSGQGEAMVANRVPGIRAAVYYGPADHTGGSRDVVILSREHNDANVLSLGARFISATEAEEAVTLWLSTKFSNDGRHIRRIKKIDDNA